VSADEDAARGITRKVVFEWPYGDQLMLRLLETTIEGVPESVAEIREYIPATDKYGSGIILHRDVVGRVGRALDAMGRYWNEP
jgi:hypothetical protein